MLYKSVTAKGAEFSENGKYRYSLSRVWDSNKPPCMFVGLNPSTANGIEDDPTIRRVMRFAQDWSHGAVFMLNCFPLVSAYPEALEEFLKAEDYKQHQEKNMEELIRHANVCPKIVFAWGNFEIVKQTGMDKKLSDLFPNALALVVNQDGSPRHPLYVKADTYPIPFKYPTSKQP